MGDSKSPMYFIAVACAANIALDYLFIGGLKLDAAGAALGTTLSQTISVIVSLAVILKRRMISLTTKDFRPHRTTMLGVLKIGVPVALQDGFIQVAFIVITIIANRRGLNDAAAVGIVEKLIAILFLVPSSMLSTVSALKNTTAPGRPSATPSCCPWDGGVWRCWSCSSPPSRSWGCLWVKLTPTAPM